MIRVQKNRPLAYDVPLDDLVNAARGITGWRLAAVSSHMDPESCVVTELWFEHAGGILFPARKLKVEGVKRIHHFVEEGKAHVWVTWKAQALAGAS